MRSPAGSGPLLALALLSLPGCGAPEPETSASGPPNILLVLVDTLRADRLSLYGYQRDTSPNLDRFARQRGVVFENAWANAGCTFPSVNSILTGRWPQRFMEERDPRDFTIHPETPTLAERLGARGYSTAAVSASRVVRATPSKINERGGFDRGFDRFDEDCEELDAGCVNARAFAELDRLEEPFLLYLHYLDPHAPYDPPEETQRQWSPTTAEGVKRWAQRGKTWRIQQRIYENAVKYHFGEPEIRHLSDLYDEEIRHFDRHFGELVAELERRGLDRRTVLAFVSDHGEELYENGGWGHCRGALWETILETPFLLSVPGIAPGERTTPVSNIDLTPTLLDLAGVRDPEGGLDGSSLRRRLERTESRPEPRRLYAAQGQYRAARDLSLKVRLDLASGASELLTPSIAEPIVSEPGRRGSELIAALANWLRDQEGSTRAESVQRAEELEAELKALGYL